MLLTSSIIILLDNANFTAFTTWNYTACHCSWDPGHFKGPANLLWSPGGSGLWLQGSGFQWLLHTLVGPFLRTWSTSPSAPPPSLLPQATPLRGLSCCSFRVISSFRFMSEVGSSTQVIGFFLRLTCCSGLVCPQPPAQRKHFPVWA